VTLDEKPVKLEDDVFDLSVEQGEKAITVEFGEDDVRTTIDTFKYNAETTPFVRESEEEKKRKRVEELREKRKSGATSDFKLSPNVAIDNPANIKTLEKTPAYKRKQVVLDDVKSGDDLENDNYRVTIDSEEVISSNNSYLHDNVD